MTKKSKIDIEVTIPHAEKGTIDVYEHKHGHEEHFDKKHQEENAKNKHSEKKPRGGKYKVNEIEREQSKKHAFHKPLKHLETEKK